MPSNSSTTEAAAQAAVAARRAALEAERQAAEARPSVGALRVWLGAVAAMRFFSVVVGYIDVSYLQRGVFDLQPDQVTGATGRTFAVWTAVTCALCLFTAKALAYPGPSVLYIYQATLLSFVIALGFFVSEVAIFHTVSLRCTVAPGIVAGTSIVWMTKWYQRSTESTDRLKRRTAAAAHGASKPHTS